MTVDPQKVYFIVSEAGQPTPVQFLKNGIPTLINVNDPMVSRLHQGPMSGDGVQFYNENGEIECGVQVETYHFFVDENNKVRPIPPGSILQGNFKPAANSSNEIENNDMEQGTDSYENVSACSESKSTDIFDNSLALGASINETSKGYEYQNILKKPDDLLEDSEVDLYTPQEDIELEEEIVSVSDLPSKQQILQVSMNNRKSSNDDVVNSTASASNGGKTSSGRGRKKKKVKPKETSSKKKFVVSDVNSTFIMPTPVRELDQKLPTVINKGIIIEEDTQMSTNQMDKLIQIAKAELLACTSLESEEKNSNHISVTPNDTEKTSLQNKYEFEKTAPSFGPMIVEGSKSTTEESIASKCDLNENINICSNSLHKDEPKTIELINGMDQSLNKIDGRKDEEMHSNISVSLFSKDDTKVVDYLNENSLEIDITETNVVCEDVNVDMNNMLEKEIYPLEDVNEDTKSSNSELSECPGGKEVEHDDINLITMDNKTEVEHNSNAIDGNKNFENEYIINEVKIASSFQKDFEYVTHCIGHKLDECLEINAINNVATININNDNNDSIIDEPITNELTESCSESLQDNINIKISKNTVNKKLEEANNATVRGEEEANNTTTNDEKETNNTTTKEGKANNTTTYEEEYNMTTNKEGANNTTSNDKGATNTTTNDEVTTNTTTNDEVANNTITNDEEANNTTTNDEIANNTTTNDEVANNTTTNDEVANNTTTNDEEANYVTASDEEAINTTVNDKDVENNTTNDAGEDNKMTTNEGEANYITTNDKGEANNVTADNKEEAKNTIANDEIIQSVNKETLFSPSNSKQKNEEIKSSNFMDNFDVNTEKANDSITNIIVEDHNNLPLQQNNTENNELAKIDNTKNNCIDNDEEVKNETLNEEPFSGFVIIETSNRPNNSNSKSEKSLKRKHNSPNKMSFDKVKILETDYIGFKNDDVGSEKQFLLSENTVNKHTDVISVQSSNVNSGHHINVNHGVKQNDDEIVLNEQSGQNEYKSNFHKFVIIKSDWSNNVVKSANEGMRVKYESLLVKSRIVEREQEIRRKSLFTLHSKLISDKNKLKVNELKWKRDDSNNKLLIENLKKELEAMKTTHMKALDEIKILTSKLEQQERNVKCSQSVIANDCYLNSVSSSLQLDCKSRRKSQRILVKEEMKENDDIKSSSDDRDDIKSVTSVETTESNDSKPSRHTRRSVALSKSDSGMESKLLSTNKICDTDNVMKSQRKKNM